MTLQSWTVVLRARGDAKRAEQVVRRSIDMREGLFGP